MSDVDKKFREEQLKRVRNLKQVTPKPKTKSNFAPKMTVMRKSGRGR
jgi:hypothetical protein